MCPESSEVSSKKFFKNSSMDFIRNSFSKSKNFLKKNPFGNCIRFFFRKFILKILKNQQEIIFEILSSSRIHLDIFRRDLSFSIPKNLFLKSEILQKFLNYIKILESLAWIDSKISPKVSLEIHSKIV